MEYQEQDENLMKTTRIPELPTENEFLGLEKFISHEPNINLPNKRSETQRFLNSNTNNMFEDNFISDNYLKLSVCHPIQEQSNDTKEYQGCKCIKEFYDNNSKL